MNQFIQEWVKAAFESAKYRERILNDMDNPALIQAYDTFFQNQSGLETMQIDALAFEDCIVMRADMVIRELYRIDAMGITQ